MRSRSLLFTSLPFFAVVLFAQGAGAALLRYDLRDFTLIHFTPSSPNVFLGNIKPTPADPSDLGVTLIDDSGAAPVLRKLVQVRAAAQTTDAPQLGGFIFFSGLTKEGPTGTFTGTGSTASTIAWGAVTGWTITGGQFCNAQPSFICTLAGFGQLGTIQPLVDSNFYDIGTWVFHGTGFTSQAGFVAFTSTNAGNNQFFIKGTLNQTGSVPALPVLGLGALAASLVAMGLAALRRRKQS